MLFEGKLLNEVLMPSMNNSLIIGTTLKYGLLEHHFFDGRNCLNATPYCISVGKSGFFFVRTTFGGRLPEMLASEGLFCQLRKSYAIMAALVTAHEEVQRTFTR
jgi:hypothetical protein